MRYSAPKRLVYEPEVQNNLGITPSDMADMAAKGIPVSAQNLGLGFQEGVSKLDYDVPPEFQRGIDIADVWNLKEDTKSKLRSLKNKLISQPKTE